MNENLQNYIAYLERIIVLLVDISLNLLKVIASLNGIIIASISLNILMPLIALFSLYWWWDIVDYFEAKKENKGGKNEKN